MLLQLVETLRRWESHCLGCRQCDGYDKSGNPAWLDNHNGTMSKAPCGEGRAIILTILNLLEGGL